MLTGPQGSILVPANYTYHAIGSMAVDVTIPGEVSTAVNAEDSPVRVRKRPNGVHLELPLAWTDMVILRR